MPVMPGRSLRLPTRYHVYIATFGMSLSGQTTSFMPFGSVRVTIWSAPGTSGAAACAAAPKISAERQPGGAPCRDHRRGSTNDTDGSNVAAHWIAPRFQRWLAIQRSTLASSTSSGSAPSISTAVWNLRTSNFGPSSFSARARSSLILSWPILYASAWPGIAM